jgi:hypothetical protein
MFWKSVRTGAIKLLELYREKWEQFFGQMDFATEIEEE